MRKVMVAPFYRGADDGEGGIRRVTEAMARHLPALGYEVTDTLDGADLVHVHAGAPVDVPVGVPLISSNHGLYWSEYQWPEWAYKLNAQVVDSMRQADHVTACSEWVANVLRRGMWLNPTVLYHGVDLAEWQGGTDGGYVLWDKAYPHQVSDPGPMNELARRMPDVPFVSTFGEPAANVKITGRVPYLEAATLTRDAGAYLATTRETMGISILQALAAGVPVVGWRWGGAREVVRHGETGWLATPGDFGGLVEGVRWALEGRDRIGAAAQADVAERWTWETAMGRYAALYDRLLGEQAERRQGPRVSVVVPCYNLAKYLPETLDSVLAQTEPSWECIVVDDASTDGSGAIARGYAARDSRITYLRNDRNMHVSYSRNRGLAAAAGRYLICLDADDRLTPAALEVLADALDGDRGLGMAYGGLQIMSEAGEVRPSSHDWPPAEFSFRDQVEGRNQVPTLCMYRRSMIERTGGYRSRLSPVEDADLWTRAASIGFVPRKVTEATTLLYRLRGDSISRTMKKQEWAGWYPWSQRVELTPFGAAMDPPARLGPGKAWPVPTYEPVQVAVIIPVGPGHERMVLDAIDSVQAQTYLQWECIVVNDTGAPLVGLPSWVRVIEGGAYAVSDLAPSSSGSGVDSAVRRDPCEAMGNRLGVAKARNLGVGASAAPLFVPLDADDYLQPDALAELVAAQRAMPRAAGSPGGVVYSDWYDDKGAGSAEVYLAPDYDARLLTTKGCIHAVTAIYPRAAWELVGGFDEALSHWEDWDFQLKLASRGVCSAHLPLPLWTYRKLTGQRREQNQAAFDDGKKAILSKWARVWEGKEQLMACRTCGGSAGRVGSITANGNGKVGGGGAAASNAAPSEDAVLLEFMGSSPSVREFRGKATNTVYRFGNISSARVKYVHAADAPFLLSLAGQFRRVELPAAGAASPQIEATTPAMNPVSASVGGGEGNNDAWAHAPGGPAAAPIAPSEPETLTQRGLRERLPSMSAEEMRVMLATERAAETPRTSIIKLLEVAIDHADRAAELEPVGANAQ